MTKKIVISRLNNISAILHNNRTQEIVSVNNTYQVNDIYLGSVHKIFTSINAAFIKLDKHKKSGFIHISDTKPLKKSRMSQSINEILSIDQLLCVQITKEPTINKGPRLTANIRLYGRYLILMPFCNTICISNKIYDENERSYLNALAILLKPATMGLLVRSSASGINEEALLEDFYSLQQQWYFIQKAIIYNHTPSLLYKDENLIKKTIKDFYDNNTQIIIIDSQDGLKELRYYLHKWYCLSTMHNIRLQLFKKSNCILKKFNITTSIVEALKPKVNLSLGGYIFIENYEALTVIDVNSGSFNQSDNSRETILKTNCYAATEIAYQLKIRNINGVVIIDFIDMQSHKDQLTLLEHFNKALKTDRAKPQIVQLSELGLVELTRRRQGQSLHELLTYNNELYSTFDHLHEPKIYYNKLEQNSIVNRNINSLFFNKDFYCKIDMNNNVNKKSIRICNRKLPNNKKLILNDNLTVPLTLYSKITDESTYFT